MVAAVKTIVIYYLDDDKDCLQLFRHGVKIFNSAHVGVKIELHTFNDAQHFLIQQKCPDIAILDYVMNGTTGLEVFEEYLQQHRCPETVMLLKSMLVPAAEWTDSTISSEELTPVNVLLKWRKLTGQREKNRVEFGIRARQIRRMVGHE